MIRVTKEEYAAMAEQSSPKSPVWKNCLFAFLVGGLICTMGQILFNLYGSFGLAETEARMAVSISLIFLSALLTACGVYDDLARYAGAGTLVPITGFANSMVSPAMEFKSEGFVMGMGAKLFTIAGPVLTFGITASFLYGIIYYLVRFVLGGM